MQGGDPSQTGRGSASSTHSTFPQVRPVDIDLVEARVASDGRRHWASTMLGLGGSWVDLMRDVSFLRPIDKRAPAIVREYRRYARDAFLWTRNAEYQRRLHRFAWTAPLSQTAASARFALTRGGVGRTRLAQFRAMCRLATGGVRPWDFHRFGLYNVDEDTAICAVTAIESACVHLSLHRHVDFKAIDDKERLQARAASAGLRTPTTLCVVVPTTSTEEVVAALPQEDIFVKRIDYGWGIGAAQFVWQNTVQRWVDEGGSAVDRGELARLLCAMAAEFPLLVQRRLRTGGSVRDLSPGGLSTLRIVTLRDSPGAAPRTLAAILRMPSDPQSITDNFAGGGMAAELDLATGTLGVARIKKSFTRTFEVHPSTGARIAGRTVDEGAAACDLARAAHALFPNVLTVGWDIAITDDGPTLLEGNLLWCSELMQSVTRRPLLSTEYAASAAHWVRESQAFRS